MTLRAWMVLGAALAALVAASVFLVPVALPGDHPMALATDGVGPLRLGRDYDDAASAARTAAPHSAFAGVGCGGLDEIRYSGDLAGMPVTVMGMAESGVLVEIEVSLDAPLEAADEGACVALRDQLGAPFIARFGAAPMDRVLHKPVSTEHRARHGPVELIARWFATGRSCYVSVLYGQDLPPGTVPK